MPSKACSDLSFKRAASEGARRIPGHTTSQIAYGEMRTWEFVDNTLTENYQSGGSRKLALITFKLSGFCFSYLLTTQLPATLNAMSEGITENAYRTHTNGELAEEHIGQTVRLSGWVHTRRDHGGLIFIDLRDRWGLTQLTFDPKRNEKAWDAAQQLRNEYVIRVEGLVAKRPESMVNAKLKTGSIEIEASSIDILSVAKTPPFEISAGKEVNEDLRLEYRFLDLRRDRLQGMLRRRDDFITHIRSYMKSRGFTDVQTPILANSSPEGARDFLVPSRLHPGKFYALPQAPQQFKQLLMIGGLDRYFQIAPCFRDEDPRADRSPGEFYQLDLEMSFVEQEDVFAVVEPLMIELTDKFSTKKIIKQPFPRLTWKEAMTRYGTDKPDLRFDMSISDISSLVRDCEFAVFTQALESGGVVYALHVPGGASFSRQDIDELTQKATELGAKGLAYMLFKEEVSSPILKYIGADRVKAIQEQLGMAKGDAVFFSADTWMQVCKSLGAVRDLAASKLALKDNSKAAWCWVVDFPMYERTLEGTIDFSHNPFSMPQGGLKALETEEPADILGYQYDLALNGYEISSGAIRNHRPDTMYKAFAIAGYSKTEVDQKFGGMIKAFEYGAPPHGGFAPGIDRLMMVLWDLSSTRDVYAFPKNGRMQDAMMGAPSEVDPQQLQELHLKVDLED